MGILLAQNRLSALALVLISLASLPFATAGPYPRDNIHDAGYGYLFERDCTSYCGTDNQYCCESNEICTTQNAIATCVQPQVGVDIYTTTWTETRVFTKTVSSTFQLVTTEAVMEQCVPPVGSGQTACGNICCARSQVCAFDGQCVSKSSGLGGIPFTTTIDGVITTGYSAPFRPTSAATTTTTVGPEGTSIEAVGSNGGGLSGGAIAGIVIGVIAGVILLLMICACCLIKGAFAGVMRLIGGKKDKHDREKIIVDEERYVRHGSPSHSRRNTHDSWHGDHPVSAAGRRKKDESGGGKGLLGLAAGLGGLLLGLKRHEDKKSKGPKSRSNTYSSTYYTSTYSGSTPSSSSSRRTRQTRGSRGTRHTRTSRRSSRRS